MPRCESISLPLALILAVSACGAPSREVAERLPAVDISTAAPEVREQLHAARRRAVRALSPDEAGDTNRGATWGRLGEHYHAYEFHQAAARCYARARELAPEEPRWAYLAGVVAQQRGDLESAERAFRASHELAADDPAIALRLGEVLLDRGRSSEVEPLLRRAATHPGLAAAAEAALGRAAGARGNPRAAIEHYRRALELQPAATSLYVPLARSLRLVGRDAEAKAALTRAGADESRREDPILRQVFGRRQGVAPLLARAGRRAGAGDLEAAEALYRRALSSAPTSVEAKKGLVGVFLQRGAFDEAQPLIEETLARQPDDVEARLRLARVLELRGVRERALAEYERAVRSAPSQLEPRLALAAALQRMNRAVTAIEHYEAVLARDSGERSAILGRIQALADLGRLREARQEMAAYLSTHPADLEAHLMAAQLAARNGDPAAAEGFRRVLEANRADPSTSARAAQGLGNLAAQRQAWDEAEAAFTRALELDPELHAARMALGWILLETGRPAVAAQQFRRLVERQPASLSAWLAEIQALAAADDLEAARERLRIARGRFPDSTQLRTITTRLESSAATAP